MSRILVIVASPEVLIIDDALLAEEPEGEGDGQKSYGTDGPGDDAVATCLRALLFNLALLFLGMIASSVELGLALKDAVAELLFDVGIVLPQGDALLHAALPPSAGASE